MALVVVGVVLAAAFGQYVVYGVIPMVVGGMVQYQRSAKKPLKWWKMILAILALFAGTYVVLVLGVMAYEHFRS